MGTHRSVESSPTPNWSRHRTPAAAVAVVGLTLASFAVWSPSASAATAIDLGSADSYSVLAGSEVTNTGASNLWGDVGVSPGTAVTGFPPGIVGGVERTGLDAAPAKADLLAAYNTAANLAGGTAIDAELGGETLLAGVYKATSSTGITGTVTLDGNQDPASV